jgi:hypothetical protein
MYHPILHASQNLVNLSEIARVLNEDGFALIGFPAKIWREHKLLHQIADLDKSGRMIWLSLQFTEMDDLRMLYYMVLIRGK